MADVFTNLFEEATFHRNRYAVIWMVMENIKRNSSKKGSVGLWQN
jgi:hypothetical protein